MRRLVCIIAISFFPFLLFANWFNGSLDTKDVFGDIIESKPVVAYKYNAEYTDEKSDSFSHTDEFFLYLLIDDYGDEIWNIGFYPSLIEGQYTTEEISTASIMIKTDDGAIVTIQNGEKGRRTDNGPTFGTSEYINKYYRYDGTPWTILKSDNSSTLTDLMLCNKQLKFYIVFGNGRKVRFNISMEGFEALFIEYLKQFNRIRSDVLGFFLTLPSEGSYTKATDQQLKKSISTDNWFNYLIFEGKTYTLRVDVLYYPIYEFDFYSHIEDFLEIFRTQAETNNNVTFAETVNIGRFSFTHLDYSSKNTKRHFHEYRTLLHEYLILLVFEEMDDFRRENAEAVLQSFDTNSFGETPDCAPDYWIGNESGFFFSFPEGFHPVYGFDNPSVTLSDDNGVDIFFSEIDYYGVLPESERKANPRTIYNNSRVPISEIASAFGIPIIRSSTVRIGNIEFYRFELKANEAIGENGWMYGLVNNGYLEMFILTDDNSITPDRSILEETLKTILL